MNDIAPSLEAPIDLPTDETPPEPEAPAIAKTRKQICIVGTTPSRMEGPINDPDWEVWTIGPGGKDNHRWDRLYEVHGRWPLDFGELADGKSYLDDLSKVEPPQQICTAVPMQTAMQDWARESDKSDEWLAEHITGDWAANRVVDAAGLFERHGKVWFSSSISYAIADAIEENATDIAIFGIDLESGEEYLSQFPGCRHLMDVAQKYLGINIIVPKGCGLLRDPLPYPDRFETHQALMLERKVGWLEAMLGEQTAAHEDGRMMTHRVEGALLKVRQFNDILAKGEPLTQEMITEELKAGETELVQHSRGEQQSQANLNHLRGELSGLRFCQRMWVFGTVDPNFDLTVKPPL